MGKKIAKTNYDQERKKGKESLIIVAAVQMESRFGDKKYNLQKQLKLIKKTAEGGGNLIVLPELGTTGYLFNNRNNL